MSTELDTNKIGRTVAKGGDFIVKEYGDNQVIKFSTLYKILGDKHKTKLVSDYKICEKYFSKYIVKTKVINHPKQYIEIQDFITGEKLVEKHLENKEVREQMLDILSIFQKIQREKREDVDLIGFEGMTKFCYGNIIVDENNKLKFIDATFFESKSLGILGQIYRPFVALARAIQYFQINRTLDIIKQLEV